ncbi:HAD-like domain-containing protein [Sporodiniella umbellata]|nr:HAD-like domain-containing protein [Sporodiniella umbellata]
MPFVAFELLDTLCDFEKVVCQIELMLNKQHDICISHQRASRFFFNWYNSALRDHIATSFAGKYCPLKKVLEATLLRALYHEGFEDIVDETTIMSTLEAVRPSANAFAALKLLKDKEWDIWILSTSGTREETLEFLKRIGFLNYIDSQNILCCDNLRVSRPHPRVYSELMRLAVHQTKRIENFYFVGSYAFDIASAKNMSLRTVYLDTREKIYTQDMYNNGAPDIVGNNLVDCVQKMIQYEKSKRFL